MILLSLNFYFNNRFSNAVISTDKNPEFRRAMAQWFKSWENSKLPNFEEFTSTFQTFSALQRNFLCQASLIEDLLDNGFEYVMAANFQIDSKNPVDLVSIIK